MLQAIREKAMGVLGWIIIGLIIITFALFGLGSYLQNKSRVFAALVNDVEIAPRDLQMAYQQQRARMEQALGDAFNPALIDDQLLRQRALDSLIQRELLLQAAQEDGLVVSDQLLAAQIQSAPAFQSDGKFSEERYKTALFQRGQSPAVFEYQTRRLLQAEQLVDGLSNTTFVIRDELDRVYRLQDQKRDFSYLLIAAALLEEGIEISDIQVQEYYDQHSEEFVTPERVRLAYLRLTGEALSASIEIEEEDLLAYYDEKRQSLQTQEQRRASHILIQVAADADEQARNEARAQAEDLLAQIRAGADFAELAKQHSDDPGSAAQGGDLGYFARGAMVAEFDETVFSMETGSVSEPVRTQFGFHIIKLAEVRGSQIPELEEVRGELVSELKQRDVDDLYYEQLEQLTDTSYENPESLDAAAEALGLEVQTSDWLTAQGGTGIGEYPKVRAVAFSEDVLEAGNNSEPVEVANSDAIVVRVVEREAAQPSPLENVKDQIVATLRQQEAARLAEVKGAELLEKLRQGGAIEELGGADGITLRKAEAVNRAAPGFDPEVVREVFRLERPQEGATVEQGIALNNGDYAVVRLTRVSDADPAAMPENVRTQLERSIQNMQRAVTYATLVEDLRARANIVIPEEEE